jgi:hypothetical protein
MTEGLTTEISQPKLLELVQCFCPLLLCWALGTAYPN